MTIADYDFTRLPTLETPRLRLEPQSAHHVEGLWASVNDQETLRLTGTHARFTEEQIRGWLDTVSAADGRADWAVVRRAVQSYRKIGFVEEGRMRDALHWDGEWVDALMMSILSTDPRR